MRQPSCITRQHQDQDHKEEGGGGQRSFQRLLEAVVNAKGAKCERELLLGENRPCGRGSSFAVGHNLADGTYP